MERRIYAADIGSTRCTAGGIPNFAWARVDPERPTELVGSSDISMLATSVAAALELGQNVALGFEAPLFLPVPEAASDLCRRRAGEGSRSFAAPAGLAVTALGLHQAAWVLRFIRQHCVRSLTFTTSWRDWPPAEKRSVLFCWEAFVSGPAHSDTHIRDAATAVMAFLTNERDLGSANAVTAEAPLSLIATAAIWSGLSSDIGQLGEPTLVIKPAQPFTGVVGAA